MVAIRATDKKATAFVFGRNITKVTFDKDVVVTFPTLELVIQPESIAATGEEFEDVPDVPGVVVKRIDDGLLRFDSAICPEFWCEVRVVPTSKDEVYKE